MHPDQKLEAINLIISVITWLIVVHSVVSQDWLWYTNIRQNLSPSPYTIWHSKIQLLQLSTFNRMTKWNVEKYHICCFYLQQL